MRVCLRPQYFTNGLCVDLVLNKHKQLPLTNLLAQLFPAPLDALADTHITRTMCGVISTRLSNAAWKSLGITKVTDGQRLMRELQLLCVNSLHTFFTALKPALP